MGLKMAYRWQSDILRSNVRFNPESGPFSALAFMSAFDPKRTFVELLNSDIFYEKSVGLGTGMLLVADDISPDLIAVNVAVQHFVDNGETCRVFSA